MNENELWAFCTSKTALPFPSSQLEGWGYCITHLNFKEKNWIQKEAKLDILGRKIGSAKFCFTDANWLTRESILQNMLVIINAWKPTSETIIKSCMFLSEINLLGYNKMKDSFGGVWKLFQNQPHVQYLHAKWQIQLYGK